MELLKISKGLSIPYNFYNGALKVSENQSAEALKSNQSLLKFADYLNQLQQEKTFTSMFQFRFIKC